MFESLHAAVCIGSGCDLIRHAGFHHRCHTAGHRLLLHPEILQSRIKVTSQIHLSDAFISNSLLVHCSCNALSRCVLLDLDLIFIYYIQNIDPFPKVEWITVMMVECTCTEMDYVS